MKSTQVEWVVKQIETKGKVSRNQALRRYITRLGAIVCTLRDSGYAMRGEYVTTRHGKDYVYSLIKNV